MGRVSAGVQQRSGRDWHTVGAMDDRAGRFEDAPQSHDRQSVEADTARPEASLSAARSSIEKHQGDLRVESPRPLSTTPEIPMTDLSAEYKALASYRPVNKVRFVTAASLFDG